MKLKRYLNSKNISKILALGLLVSSIPINSFASILSDDYRYETFEDSNITINDVLEEDNLDVEIEGNTLVNLLGKDNYKGNINILYQNLGISALTVKAGQEYTFITNTNVPYHLKYVNDNSICLVFEKGSYKAKFTANQDSKMMLIVTTSSGEYDVDGLLLEGDWTNKEIPRYFEGMKSVGQDDVDDHKIEITSRNKNLFIDDVVNQTGSGNSGNGKIYPLMFVNNNTRCRSANPIKVKPNTTYYFSSNNKFYFAIAELDKDNKQILENGWTIPAQGGKHTTSENCQSIVLIIRKTDGTSLAPEEVYGNVQIEENDIETTYIAPSSSMKEVLLSEPLRGLPNGTRDRVVKRNGKWYIERNCREVILDGSEQWSTLKLNYYNNKNIGFSYIDIPNICINNNDEVTTISDRFYGLTYNSTYASETDGVEGISAGNIHKLYIFIDKNKLSTPDTNGLKDWLKNNPTKVIYQLEEPTYELLNIDLTLDLYLESTHISTNSIIPANLKVTVDRVSNRAKECIGLAKENPTIGNISLARMWINLMRESILKDEFHKDVNSITEVVDMTLERKTASANLDLYIKCENMLSMSLDTNVITFEDFSGVEDTIKENTVNININSSLPYNLNAYLATDIQSSDKSNSMDLNILSIKENSELDYQKFSSINNKLILKSNCESGNYKLHNIDLKLNAGVAHEKDVYKTTIQFEAEQV